MKNPGVTVKSGAPLGRGRSKQRSYARQNLIGESKTNSWRDTGGEMSRRISFESTNLVGSSQDDVNI